MGDLEHALSAYENALRHNPMSLSGLTQVAGIARIKENYPKVRFTFFYPIRCTRHCLMPSYNLRGLNADRRGRAILDPHLDLMTYFYFYFI